MEKKIIIEVGGMPEAGKTTLIEHLRTWFIHYHKTVPFIISDQGKSIQIPRSAEDPNLNSLHYTIWTYNSMINHLIEAIYSEYKIIIIDRGPIDMSIFSFALEKWFNYSETLDEIAIKKARDYLKIFAELIDVFILLRLPWEDSYRRETLPFQKIFGSVIRREKKEQLLKELEKIYNEDPSHYINFKNKNKTNIITVNTQNVEGHIVLNDIINKINIFLD